MNFPPLIASTTRAAGLTLALLALTLLSTSCAFDDGAPWGWVVLDLEQEGVAGEASLSIDAMSLTIASARLLSEGGAQGAAGELDLANPPPGFSLCHNGHCHADDGRLVPYDEVIQESAAGPQLISASTLDESLNIGERSRSRLKIVQRTDLQQVEVELSAMVIEGALVRGENEVRYRANVPVRGLRLSAPIALQVDAESPMEQRLGLRITLAQDITAALDLSEATLEDDGTLRITNTRNRVLAELLLEGAAEHLRLQLASP